MPEGGVRLDFAADPGSCCCCSVRYSFRAEQKQGQYRQIGPEVCHKPVHCVYDKLDSEINFGLSDPEIKK